jgi:phosphotriesterase-related protein
MVPDTGYHREIAERGAWVEFDTIQGGTRYQLARIVAAIRALDDAGHGDRLLLSQDICLTSQFRALGGPGYGYILRELMPLLRSEGFAESWLERVLVENPARALTGA